MKARLSFYLDLEYELTVYNILKEMSLSVVPAGDSKYRWFFPIEKISEVKKYVTFEFGDELKKMVDLPEWKGKSGYEIITLADMYICQEWWKDETGKVRESRHTVTKEQAVNLWKIMKKHPINKKIKTQTIAKNLVESLGITRFHRDTVSFNWGKFFGERKDGYFRLYYPLKVLCDRGLVKHHKNGFVERLKDTWEEQSEVKGC